MGPGSALALLACPGRREFFSRFEFQTADTRPRSRGTICPKLCNSLSLKNEGAGNAGCALHPRISCAKGSKKGAHERNRAAENIRHSLRNGFTAYNALTPEYRALLASVVSRKMARRSGWTLAPPQDL